MRCFGLIGSAFAAREYVLLYAKNAQASVVGISTIPTPEQLNIYISLDIALEEKVEGVELNVRATRRRRTATCQGQSRKLIFPQFIFF